MDIQIHAFGGTLEKMERALTYQPLVAIHGFGKTSAMLLAVSPQSDKTRWSNLTSSPCQDPHPLAIRLMPEMVSKMITNLL